MYSLLEGAVEQVCEAGMHSVKDPMVKALAEDALFLLVAAHSNGRITTEEFHRLRNEIQMFLDMQV